MGWPANRQAHYSCMAQNLKSHWKCKNCHILALINTGQILQKILVWYLTCRSSINMTCMQTVQTMKTPDNLVHVSWLNFFWSPSLLLNLYTEKPRLTYWHLVDMAVILNMKFSNAVKWLKSEFPAILPSCECSKTSFVIKSTYWPMWGEATWDKWFHVTKGQ